MWVGGGLCALRVLLNANPRNLGPCGHALMIANAHIGKLVINIEAQPRGPRPTPPTATTGRPVEMPACEPEMSV